MTLPYKTIFPVYCMYVFLFSSCISDSYEKKNTCEEFKIDSFHFSSVDVFIETNIDMLNTYYFNQGDKDSLCKIDKSIVSMFSPYKTKNIEGLNLQCYGIYNQTSLEYLNLNILENTKTSFKCVLPLGYNKNLESHNNPDIGVLGQMNKFKNYDVVGIQRYLNNSNLKMKDINTDDIRELFKYYLVVRDTFKYKKITEIKLNDTKQLEKFKHLFLKKLYYNKKFTEYLFEYFTILHEFEKYGIINILIYDNYNINWLQIVSPEYFEPFNEYKFIVNYYVF